MNRLALRLLTFAWPLVVAACAISPEASVERATPENFAKVVVGRTTAAQVSELLGPQNLTLRSRTHGGEEWGYRYQDSFGSPLMFWIAYSPDGIVRNAAQTIDWERDRLYLGQ